MTKSIHSRRQAALIRCLVDARNEAGLTQQVVADQLGKPQSFVAKYENGERRLDVVEFIQIADVLGTDPCEMIEAVRGASMNKRRSS